MNWQELFSLDWAPLINWLTNDVDDSTKSFWTNWHQNGVSSIIDFLTSNKTFSRVKSNGSDVVTTQMLGNFENQSVFNALDFKSIENRWERAFELNINDGSNNLRNSTL